MSISPELRERIRIQAGDRCGYCQSAQRYVFAPLEIEHLQPTPCGRATVMALQMNNLIAVMVRREWVAAGWHPPIA